jgi:hypothetical protein
VEPIPTKTRKSCSFFFIFYKNKAYIILSTYTANVDFVRFEYVVLAKYQHLQILEFNLLIKQHILILCKNLLSWRCLIILSNPCYQVGFCTDHISTIQKCATVVQLFAAGSCFCGWCGGGGSTVLSTLSSTNKQCMLSY